MSAVLEPLLTTIASVAPDVVVVSGDLTQPRPRRRVSPAARDFLARIAAPMIVVPQTTTCRSTASGSAF